MDSLRFAHITIPFVVSLSNHERAHNTLTNRGDATRTGKIAA